MLRKLKPWLTRLRDKVKRFWKELIAFLVFLVGFADYLNLIDVQSVLGWFIKDEQTATAVASAISFILFLLRLAVDSGAIGGDV